MSQTRWRYFGLSLLSIVAYIWIAYFLDRSHFYEILACFGLAFMAYYGFMRNSKTEDLPFLLGLGILFRLLFLLSVPSLSDDYFRFIWDGQLMAQGLNPFDQLPDEVKINFPNKDVLLNGMNSPNYYTVYPPIAQSIYFIAAKLSPHSIFGSIVVMRSILLLAEIGVILLLPRLLKRLQINLKHALWYVLNPLVIVELTGNLHFEGVMIFFLLLAFYFLRIEKTSLSSLAWAFSAAVKLIPIFLLPIILPKLSFKKALLFFLLFALVFLGLWIPYYNLSLVDHFLSSLSLYSQHFEFNAGVYYLVRAVGYFWFDYNIIQTAGPVLAALAYAGMLLILLHRKVVSWSGFFNLMLLALSWYYFLALIVHPWYICSLVFLAVFSRYRFPMLWSFLAVLSYWAYSNPGFQENYRLIALEYVLVIGFAVYEGVFKSNKGVEVLP